MHSVRLPGSAIGTSRLGFGTAGLLREPSTKKRLDILAAAFDAGFRHFDTAPIYGLGEAERLLGEFLSRRSEAVTVTTKFGLALNPLASRLRIVQSLGRTALNALPALRQFVRHRSQSFYKRPIFDVFVARSSLENSLRFLRRDHVDFFLMHECSPAHLGDPSLPEFLVRLQEKGTIGAFGTATQFHHTAELVKTHRTYCQVIQFEQCALHTAQHPLPGDGSRGVITHSVLSGAFLQVRADACVQARWSKALDMDLTAPGALAGLFIKAAIAGNPHGIVLVHSNSPRHLLENAKASEQPLEAERYHRLRRLAAALPSKVQH
jgi:D-threo-aldose 1-dehydrogenase